MKNSSVCLRDLLRVLTVVLCSVMVVVLVSGCGGGGGVDALVKEQKDLTAELIGAAADPAKAKAVTDKLEALKKKVDALSPADKEKFLKAIKTP